MKVIFDGLIFEKQFRGGISRYFIELHEAFLRNKDLRVDSQFLFGWTNNEYAVQAGIARQPLKYINKRLFRKVSMKAAIALTRALNYRYTRMAKIKKADIWHTTYYASDKYYKQVAGRLVSTVYDMIPEKFPEYFPHGNPHKNKKYVVEHSDLVICISQQTKLELLEVYGQVNAKVVTIPLGVSDFWFNTKFRQDISKTLNPPLILYVGRREGYKDFSVLLHAMTETSADIKLLVGGSRLSQFEQKLIKQLGLSFRVDQRAINDSELRDAYRKSNIFVMPSRSEGFGLPVLEAMAGGCPVLLADTAISREVGADVARYFEPGNPSSLAVAISAIISDIGLQLELSERGNTRAAQFTWERCALAHAKAYYQLLDGNLTSTTLDNNKKNVT